MLRGLLLFCLAAGGVVLVLLTINLIAMPRLSRSSRRKAPARWPRVSVVIPARNEERDIEGTVRSHLAQDYPNPELEVIAVDDCSSDRTPQILEALAKADPRLRAVPGRDPPAGWLGKPHALHVGSEAARGELILFADADVRYDPRALREAVALFEADRLDLLALLPSFVMRGFWENVLMPNIPLSYFFGPAFLANADWARWIAAGGGAGNLVRKSAYAAVGGHEAIRGSVIDDVHLALLLKESRFRCRAVRAEDRVSVHMYRGFREVWDGFTKNVAFAFQGLFGAFVLALMLMSFLPGVLPTLVLVAALLGAPVGAVELRLAAAGFLLAVAARAPVAIALRHPLWTALTNPLMTAVWTGILIRSTYYRFVRRRVLWRGRTYDARRATF